MHTPDRRKWLAPSGILLLVLTAAVELCWIGGWNPVRAVAASREEFPEALQQALRNDDPAAVMRFLRAGISPDVRDGYGQTPLQIAAASGAVDAIRILLDAGADCNLADDHGITPLGAAAAADAGAVAELLIANGAAVNPLPPCRLPLAMARERGNRQLADFLLLHGAAERR